MNSTLLAWCLLVGTLCDLVAGGSVEVPITKTNCKRGVRWANSVKSFSVFAKQLINDAQVGLISEGDINKCMNSMNGLEEIRALNEMVGRLPTIHSVCEPDFIDQLVALRRQMRDNSKRGKYSGFKKTNRLLPFLKLFSGQVALTCKKSLIGKMESAEQGNAKLKAAIETILESIKRSRSVSREEKAKLFGSNLLALLMKYEPRVLQQVENLVVAEQLKSAPDAMVEMGMTLNNQAMVEGFMESKRACNLIEARFTRSQNWLGKGFWHGTKMAT